MCNKITSSNSPINDFSGVKKSLVLEPGIS